MTCGLRKPMGGIFVKRQVGKIRELSEIGRLNPYLAGDEMMNTFILHRKIRVLLALSFSLIFSACGGGGDSVAGPVNSNSNPVNSNNGTPPPVAVPPIQGTTPVAALPIPVGAKVTDIQIVNSGTAQTNVPVTFGQAFAVGNMQAGDSLAGSIGGAVSPLQVDVKARHADGSLRHAVISAIIPNLAAGQTLTMDLQKTTPPPASIPITPAALLAAGFKASVNITLGGVAYAASADSLLASGSPASWLAGPVANEWLVSAPLKLAASPFTAHPHLQARFAIRAYTGLNQARVDVTVENDWAYEPNPQDFTYAANVVVGVVTVMPSTTIKHYHHGRWRKTFWWGTVPNTVPNVNVEVNKAYLIASKAVPNYDQAITIKPAALTSLGTTWSTAAGTTNDDGFNFKTGPMGQGILLAQMHTVGGRPDIGPLTSWQAMYLLSGNSTAKTVTLATGDLAGSWSIHYRDKKTDLPVSISTYPYATLPSNYGSSLNSKTGLYEAFPALVTGSSNPMVVDIPHEPNMAYLPYLITGDYYYLEELQFWANYTSIEQIGAYRGYSKGVVAWMEARGQAWGLRALGEAAYITPDSNALKSYFVNQVANNLTFYNNTYVTGKPNQLGFLDGSGDDILGSGIHAVWLMLYNYNGTWNGIASWQDDFFTWAVGRLSELGFTAADPIRNWKAQYPVGRITAMGYCYTDAAPYYTLVRPSGAPDAYPNASFPIFTTFAQVHSATFDWVQDMNPTSSTYSQSYGTQPCNSAAQALWNTNNRNEGTYVTGRMIGNGLDPESYVASLQPALAVAADSAIANSAAAWNTFASRPASIDYTSEPQFAIVPRK